MGVGNRQKRSADFECDRESLRGFKQGGEWCCELIRFPEDPPWGRGTVGGPETHSAAEALVGTCGADGLKKLVD